MYDLIYLGSQENYTEVKKLIAEAFPDITIEDASDDIHQYRFSVQSEKIPEKDFIKFAVRQGLAECSLTIKQMMMGGGRQPELEEILKEMKQEVI